MHCPGTEPTTGEACGTSTLLFHQCVYYDQFPEPTKFIDCRCNNQVYTCNIASEETYGKILSSFWMKEKILLLCILLFKRIENETKMEEDDKNIVQCKKK